jgi:hypothetical protein
MLPLSNPTSIQRRSPQRHLCVRAPVPAVVVCACGIDRMAPVQTKACIDRSSNHQSHTHTHTANDRRLFVVPSRPSHRPRAHATKNNPPRPNRGGGKRKETTTMAVDCAVLGSWSSCQLMVLGALALCALPTLLWCLTYFGERRESKLAFLCACVCVIICGGSGVVNDYVGSLGSI